MSYPAYPGAPAYPSPAGYPAYAPVAVSSSSSSSSSSPDGHHGHHGHHESTAGVPMSLDDVMARTRLPSPSSVSGCPFTLANSETLQIAVTSSAIIRHGCMIAYSGNLDISRKGAGSIAKKLVKAFSGEGASLIEAKGVGTLWAADQKKKVIILHLNNESIVINGNDLLALEPTLTWDFTTMRAGMLQGGLLNIKVSGKGYVAITCHGTPLYLPVSPTEPVYTDPNATVGWSGSLTPTLKTDLSLKFFIGRTTGEEFQLCFSNGTGFVIVQPFEECMVPGTPH
eukprot:TRINITY_DN1400_c0_g1_i2.p1 TRINITY_DN1400_c0_g1~~TRINITY_DN1400_c0_g1_i2.p1  ORF type:complete len:301 (+),score=99.13 TRINITY_DN1400_c0_g1_i2:57-905(+)